MDEQHDSDVGLVGERPVPLSYFDTLELAALLQPLLDGLERSGRELLPEREPGQLDDVLVANRRVAMHPDLVNDFCLRIVFADGRTVRLLQWNWHAGSGACRPPC